MTRKLIEECELLYAQARKLGISDERFREIVQQIEDIAQCSATWGGIDEQIVELRRRIINESRKKNKERPAP
ncbi:hypothetical protein GGE65_007743 [Skermanella aerolata]|uniref:hypothetical protein n=1 Tax=Skermanella aerolata TaxID=393310 RepID=UPI003D1A54E1